MLAAATPGISSAGHPPPEYAVKAAYIYNILRFVDWHQNPEFTTLEDINICVLGKNIFGKHLEPIESKEIEGKSLRIIHKHNIEQTQDCQLVFVSDQQAYPPDAISSVIGDKKIIVVGDDLKFVEKGGMFSFFVQDNKVRLAMNKSSLEKSGVHVSSLLLEVCVAYGDGQ